MTLPHVTFRHVHLLLGNVEVEFEKRMLILAGTADDLSRK